MKWFRKAADRGLVDAQFNLGVIYDAGEGVTQDYAEAAKWYRRFAEPFHGLTIVLRDALAAVVQEARSAAGLCGGRAVVPLARVFCAMASP